MSRIPLLILLLVLAGAVRAQDAPPAMDTTIGDTIVVGGESSGTGIVTAGGDTASVVDNNAETTAADSILLRTVPDSIVAAFKKDKRFAYANDPAYWTRQPAARRI